MNDAEPFFEDCGEIKGRNARRCLKEVRRVVRTCGAYHDDTELLGACGDVCEGAYPTHVGEYGPAAGPNEAAAQ